MSLKSQHGKRKTASASELPRKAEPKSLKRLIVSPASDIIAEPANWLWNGRIESGAINVISGCEGLGKSCIAIDFASRVSNGSPWPDGADCRRGRVFIWSVEEKASIVRARLEAAGADLAGIDIARGIGTDPEAELLEIPDLRDDLAMFVDHWSRNKYELIIIDTFQSSSTATQHKDSGDQKRLLQPLKEIAEATGVTVLLVEHHRRGGQGSLTHRTLGPGLSRQARSLWHVVETDDGIVIGSVRSTETVPEICGSGRP